MCRGWGWTLQAGLCPPAIVDAERVRVPEARPAALIFPLRATVVRMHAFGVTAGVEKPGSSLISLASTRRGAGLRSLTRSGLPNTVPKGGFNGS